MMCGSIHVLEALSELPPQEIEEAFLSIDESMPLSEESLEDFQKFFSYFERAGDYKRSRWMHWVPVLERLENTIDVKKLKSIGNPKAKIHQSVCLHCYSMKKCCTQSCIHIKIKVKKQKTIRLILTGEVSTMTLMKRF